MTESSKSRKNRQRTGVIYVRISANDLKDGHGLTAQLRVLRARAEREGVTIVNEFGEENKSGWKRKTKRPQYEAMLEALPQVDVLYAWSSDRLTRQNRQLEALIDRLEQHSITVSTEIGGLWNLNDPSDLLRVRIGGAVAEYESGIKSQRSKLRHQELANEGLSSGGARPYGYLGYKEFADGTIRKNGMELELSEAAVIEEVVRRAIAGESICALVNDLNRRGIPTTTGKTWRTATLRGIVTSPRIAGLREHTVDGVRTLTAAKWPAIIGMEQHARVCALVADHRLAVNPGRERKLLSGLAVCGRCGQGLRHRLRHDSGKSLYQCSRLPGEESCGRLGIDGTRLEAFVTELLWKVEMPEAMVDEAMVMTENGEMPLVDALLALDDRERSYAKLAAKGTISDHSFALFMDELADERSKLTTAVADHTVRMRGTHNVETIRAGWDGYGIPKQRALLESRFKAIVVYPGRGACSQRCEVVGNDESDEVLASMIGERSL